MWRSKPIRRLLASLAILVFVWIGGAIGFYELGHGIWSFGECAFQTIVTIFTVGFAELPQAEHVRGARSFTAVLIVFGVGAISYVQANVIALLVEGAIGQVFRRSRMQNAIGRLSGHVVVAGVGSTGRHVIEELRAINRTLVAIDRDEAHLRTVSDEACGGQLLYVVGDATSDHALTAAGISRASGVVAALTDDADNLYVTLSARALNADARIVAKAISPEAEGKMRRAGANAVVSPNTIGGRRMASELVRPDVVEFLDQMQRTEHALRMEEIVVPKTSPLVGKMLRDAPIRPRTKALVIAHRALDGKFHYNPGPESKIEPGMTLIVLGDKHDVATLRDLVANG